MFSTRHSDDGRWHRGSGVGEPARPPRPGSILHRARAIAESLLEQERRIIVQRMRITGMSNCTRYGQVVLEDPDGIVQLHIRMRPMMAHWLAHELKECKCPAISMYRLIQELLAKLGGELRVAMIDPPRVQYGRDTVRRAHLYSRPSLTKNLRFPPMTLECLIHHNEPKLGNI